MKDVIDDKKKMFGIFASKPENVTILPGLKTVFEKFIEIVKKLKHPTKVYLKIKTIKKDKLIVIAKNKSEMVAIVAPSFFEIEKQMQGWL